MGAAGWAAYTACCAAGDVATAGDEGTGLCCRTTGPNPRTAKPADRRAVEAAVVGNNSTSCPVACGCVLTTLGDPVKEKKCVGTMGAGTTLVQSMRNSNPG
jgi:hypothetical protein